MSTSGEVTHPLSGTRGDALRRICVFSGSRPGKNPVHVEKARLLGALLAAEKIGLVYGGSSVGLMGVVADAVLAKGGEVIGVIPEWLVAKEIAHGGLADLRVVASMHERKQLMTDLCDAYLALPGGFGTFDELFEVLTWAQIGLHAKPIGLLNSGGYYDPLLAMIEHVAAEGFVAPEHTRLFVVREEPDALVHAIATFAPPPLGEPWNDRRGRA